MVPSNAVRSAEKKLDELYQALRGARCANALIEAKASLNDQDFRKALQLVQTTRDFCARTPPRDLRKLAVQASAGGAGPRELLARFSPVLNLLQRLSDSQAQEPKPAAGPAVQVAPPAPRPEPPSQPSEAAAPAPAVAGKVPIGAILDMGAFTQLLTAAQQSGLVSNADAIISVRDREFRAGRYQRSLDVIEGLYAQMTAQATRRQAELRREEMQYRAGTLKMSPKEWLTRQRRERDQTQKIERARRHFARVLDGLRLLRATHPE